MMLGQGWIAWAWALLGSGSLVAACGGSSDDGKNDGGAGRAGGSAAAGTSAGTSAGSTSIAGSASGGASAGTSSGGRNTGGAGGIGGFNIGGFNVGGEGINPSDFTCDPPPEVGATCGEDAVPCLNGAAICYCDMSKWTCPSVLGGAGAGGIGPVGDLDCPETKPTTGTPCGDSVGLCPYGDGQFSGCACYQGSWACL